MTVHTDHRNNKITTNSGRLDITGATGNGCSLNYDSYTVAYTTSPFSSPYTGINFPDGWYSGGDCEFGGSVIQPENDNTSNLGASTKRWANVYSADIHLSNEGSSNDVDGTWGSYTIQEGENDLFLINKRNNKKYKFILEEVQ